MFLWLQTLSPASHSTGRWRHSRPYYQPWWYVHSYPQPHLLVPSVFQHRFYSATARGTVWSLSGTFKIWAVKRFFLFPLAENIHLELAIRGEDANPSVVVVGYNYVTVHVHCDPCGALQLPWWATSDPKPHLKLAIIWEHLEKENIQLFQNLNNAITCYIFILAQENTDLYALVVAVCHHNPSVTGGRDALQVSEFSFISPSCPCHINKTSGCFNTMHV